MVPIYVCVFVCIFVCLCLCGGFRRRTASIAARGSQVVAGGCERTRVVSEGGPCRSLEVIRSRVRPRPRVTFSAIISLHCHYYYCYHVYYIGRYSNYNIMHRTEAVRISEYIYNKTSLYPQPPTLQLVTAGEPARVSIYLRSLVIIIILGNIVCMC